MKRNYYIYSTGKPAKLLQEYIGIGIYIYFCPSTYSYMNFLLIGLFNNTDCTQAGGERIAKSCFHTNTPIVQDKIPLGWQQQDSIMAFYKLQ